MVLGSELGSLMGVMILGKRVMLVWAGLMVPSWIRVVVGWCWCVVGGFWGCWGCVVDGVSSFVSDFGPGVGEGGLGSRAGCGAGAAGKPGGRPMATPKKAKSAQERVRARRVAAGAPWAALGAPGGSLGWALLKRGPACGRRGNPGAPRDRPAAPNGRPGAPGRRGRPGGARGRGGGGGAQVRSCRVFLLGVARWWFWGGWVFLGGRRGVVGWFCGLGGLARVRVRFPGRFCGVPPGSLGRRVVVVARCCRRCRRRGIARHRKGGNMNKLFMLAPESTVKLFMLAPEWTHNQGPPTIVYVITKTRIISLC